MSFLTALAVSLLIGAVLAAALVGIGVLTASTYLGFASVRAERRRGLRASYQTTELVEGLFKMIGAVALVGVVLLCTLGITDIWTAVPA